MGCQRPRCRPSNRPNGRWRSGLAPRWQLRQAAARAKRNSTAILRSFFISSLLSLITIVACPVLTSMRKRVEFPVGLYLAPARREAVWLEHQKSDDDQPNCDLAQEGNVGVKRQSLVDGTAFQSGTDPFHGFGQQHYERRAHQRAHDRTG